MLHPRWVPLQMVCRLYDSHDTSKDMSYTMMYLRPINYRTTVCVPFTDSCVVYLYIHTHMHRFQEDGMGLHMSVPAVAEYVAPRAVVSMPWCWALEIM